MRARALKKRESASDNKVVQEQNRIRLAVAIRHYHHTQKHSIRETLHHFREHEPSIVRDIVFYRRDIDVMDIERRGVKT